MNIHKYLQTNKLDALVVNNLLNIRYLTGFSGSNAMLIFTDKRTVFVTDFRYKQQCEQELTIDAQVVITTAVHELLTEILQDCRRVAFEGAHITAAQFESYRKLLADKELLLVDIDEFRVIKTPDEIACIRKAADIANQAFTKLLGVIKTGMSEIEVAALLEYYTRSMGADKMAFDTIVASGLNSAMPHAQPTDKLLADGDFVVIDFGAVYQGYHSDMTRTFVMGQASSQQREIYNTVLLAQFGALNLIKPGTPTSKVDAAARTIIANAGYGEFFGHATGHGVGLQIHEEPRLSAVSQQILQAGMVVTNEPGIYVPGLGGVRIEDLVVVTEQGHDVLTAPIDKKLLEIY